MLKQQKFGVEDEMTGITRRQAAVLFETQARYTSGMYDTQTVKKR